MYMILKDISFAQPRENILFDEVILDLAEKGEGAETLRFWESPSYFVVLGRIGREDEDLEQAALLKDHIPVLRRASGGGTVLQGAGCLNFTFVLAKDRCAEMDDIKKSYHYILGQVIEALKELNVKVQFFPTSDLALADGRKFSGNAQKRGKKFVLHHGTILYDFDLSKISQYLRIPKQMPDYRRSRSHLDFVTNINIDVKHFKGSLAKRLDCRLEAVTEREQQALKEFLLKRDPVVHLS